MSFETPFELERYMNPVFLFIVFGASSTLAWGQGAILREATDGVVRALSKPQILGPVTREIEKRSRKEEETENANTAEIRNRLNLNCEIFDRLNESCLFPRSNRVAPVTLAPHKQIGGSPPPARPIPKKQIEFVDQAKPTQDRTTTEAWIENISDGETFLSPRPDETKAATLPPPESAYRPSVAAEKLPTGWDGRVVNMGPPSKPW